MGISSLTVYLSSSSGLYWLPAKPVEESLVRNEKEFANKLKKSDPEAWSELYEEYFTRIYRYIVVRIQNQTEAEDLTEQVFIKALDSGPSFTWRGAPISSWLFKIARNQVIDYWRANKLKNIQLLDESIVDEMTGPEGVALKNEEIRQMIQAVDELTEAQRDVIELRFAGGLSNAEVANLLGKSEGSVKVMQHSALRALRRKLADWSLS